jgi:hypothetical protein
MAPIAHLRILTKTHLGKEGLEEQTSSEELVSSEERGSIHPRKRMKGMDMVCKLKRKNVAKHNHRMDAMHSRSTTDHSHPNLDSTREERKGCKD